MILAPFELHRPDNLEDALSLVREYGTDSDFIAGGTDLLQNYKYRLNLKPHLIALDAVPELHGVEVGRIGAAETLNALGANPVVQEHYPGLCEGIRVVASPLIRNTGTIGGNLLVETRCYFFNQTPFWRDTKGSCMKAESDECLVIPQKEICYAAYSGDLAPVLMVLGASVELASPDGRRTVDLREFYRGDGIEKNVLKPDEIIVAIRIPEEASTYRAGYRKLRVRDTLDYPEMGAAAAVSLNEDGSVRMLRCATTAVDVVPQYHDFTEETSGRPLADVIDPVSRAMEKSAAPKK
ncbi:MAG: 4-hydroxybenzoyl-CoA reductase subunit beta, partial [Gemmatimonadetes bacterium]|nr:4-hydroxybenzoyl-CoA reductase subunit beta [Gemmatimonadota bacterium]